MDYDPETSMTKNFQKSARGGVSSRRKPDRQQLGTENLDAGLRHRDAQCFGFRVGV